MKVTFVAVSVPALRQVLSFKNRYRQNYPEDDLEIETFYVAGVAAPNRIRLEEIIEAVALADIAVIDTMGASESFQNVVREGLEKCQGHRIVIGNALREYLRLGSFSMGMMKK